MASRNKYPPEAHDFVKAHCAEMRDDDLAAACNEALGTRFTEKIMKAFRENHGYKVGRERWRGDAYWKLQRHYPPGMLEFVRDNSAGVSAAKMADMVNGKFGTGFSARAIQLFRKKHGIRSGLTGRFKKGSAPANKGKRMEDVCKDPERLARARGKMAPYQFKKRGKPHNELPVGSVIVNEDGYLVRKVSMSGIQRERWKFVHRLVWEEAHGPVPDGMMVIFKDGDRGNCSLENLMLVTKGEGAAMTGLGYRSRNPEATEAGLALVRLRNAAKERRKGKK